MFRKTRGLSLAELYLFDLHGYVILKNFLSKEKINKMNKIIDDAHKDDFIIKFPFLDLNPIFLDLLSDRRVMAICEQLMGKWFRFDHAFGYQEVLPHIGKNDIENLHGGLLEEQRGFQYHWYGGKPYCGQIQFGYAMYDVKPGDGGIVLIPGTHKQNIPLTARQLYYDVLRCDLDEWWVHKPALNAGDLIIFNEAVIHGTMAWKPKDRPRRSLYYKYCPGYMAWADYSRINYYHLARNNLEKRLLRGPYVGTFTESRPRWEDHYKQPTLKDIKMDIKGKVVKLANKMNARKVIRLFLKKRKK